MKVTSTLARGALTVSVLTAATAILAACGGGSTVPLGAITGTTSSTTGTTTGTTTTSGGGGTTVTQSPYLLFANDYITYASQAPDSAFLHSIQGGDVITGFGGNYTYGNYSSPQTDMNRTGFYNLQAQAKATAPTTAGDYEYVAVLAPGNSTFDISQSNSLLITMGNTVAPSSTGSTNGGHANVLTVDINNAVGTKPATGDCSYDQTLSSVGPSQLSATGVRNYAIPLSSFTCTVGSMTTLQSTGITAVVVKIVGNKNPNVVANEFDTVAVGTIGFSNWSASASDQAALAQ